jgi:hypothetical protein
MRSTSLRLGKACVSTAAAALFVACVSPPPSAEAGGSSAETRPPRGRSDAGTDLKSSAEAVTGDTAEPSAPPCLPDVGACKDLRDTEHPPLDPKGVPIVFDCFKGCGASCNSVQKSVGRAERCQDWPGAVPKHRTLAYEVLTGATHEFCTWHDKCYLQCNVRFTDDTPDYGCCIAYCDYGCENPMGFNDSCDHGRYETDHPSLTGALAFQRVCGNVDDYVPATCLAGKIPDAENPTWSFPQCLAWATTSIGHDPGGSVPSTGKTSFTKLVDKGPWSPGRCP